MLFFILSWCCSSYSSYQPGSVHPILQIVLVQNSQPSKELNQFCPPSNSDIATTFAFSSVFILLVCMQRTNTHVNIVTTAFRMKVHMSPMYPYMFIVYNKFTMSTLKYVHTGSLLCTLCKHLNVHSKLVTENHNKLIICILQILQTNKALSSSYYTDQPFL